MERLFEVPAEPVVEEEAGDFDYAQWEPEVLPPTNRELEMVVHEDRVEEVLSTLLGAYEENLFPYNLDSVRLPHDPRHMPPSLERGSVDHAMLLWNVCYYMRGGIRSVDAVRRVSSIFESHPDLFDCETAAAEEPSRVASILKEHGLGFQETVSQQWVENAGRLQERFDGDPRHIFQDVDTYEECVARIMNDKQGGGFVGFREKMTSMIAYYLMDEELIEPFVFPIPVDLHVMRVSIANGLIEFPGAPHGTNLCTEKTLQTLRELYYRYALDHEVNPLRLCDAVWLLSESLCGRYPGNITQEPLGRKNRNGRGTVLRPLPLDVESPVQQAAYEASCRQCPIENTCEYAIPGKHYYVGGSVIIRGERLRFPPPAQGRLFDGTS